MCSLERRIIRTSIGAFTLFIEHSLVFQPLPISTDTANLLAVEIWHRVVCRCTHRIDSVLPDALKERLFF